MHRARVALSAFPRLRLSIVTFFLVLATAVGACRRADTPPSAPPPGPQTEGTLKLAGLKGPVTVVRDEWGIPHITAATADDLFFVQGFIQAQDRLFQMDLWKRAVQGRLAEVLGANFIQRDSMTRRIQFRGDYVVEWARYGPDARQIAVAFTNGINAWVTQARREVPEEFAVAGWLPELWKPEDLLNRTDAFLASGGALDDLFRARMVAALGTSKVDQLLPLPRGPRTVADLGVDLSAITFVVSDALRRIGTPPFFTTLTNPVSEAPRPSRDAAGGETTVAGGAAASARGRDARQHAARIGSGAAWVVGPSRSSTNGALLAAAEFNRFETPARRYLVHLTAPGINVIGVTSPWMPGVAVGHNDKVAWAFTPTDDDTQDIFVERVNPENAHQVARDGRWVDMAVDVERVTVLGREKPVEYERLYTPNGVVIAQDLERGLVYTLRWTGTEPGGAGELAALSLIRASSAAEFRSGLSHWQAPAAEFLYADVDGTVARLRAGLVPIRTGGRGALPAAAWLSSGTWQGFRALSDSEPDINPAGGVLLGSFLGAAQTERVKGQLDAPGMRTSDDLARLQGDVLSAHAGTLLELLEKATAVPRPLLPYHRRLLSWDRQVIGQSPDATLYVAWEGAVRQRLAARLVKSELVDEFAARLDPVGAIRGPASGGAGGDTGPWREILLADALSDAVRLVEPEERGAGGTGAAGSTVTLAHPLGVFAIGQARFDAGPYPLNGHTDTVFTTDGRRGPVFRVVFDLSNWNRSLVINAPGQAGSASSIHYDDQAGRWASGSPLNLSFDLSQSALEAASTLNIEPR